MQELEKRYQSFRQYVQIAHDKGQHAPLCKLARSYTNEQQRRAQAVSAPQKSLEGADSDFSTLITVAKRCVQDLPLPIPATTTLSIFIDGLLQPTGCRSDFHSAK